MKNRKYIFLILSGFIYQFCFAQEKLRVVIAGLSHDHVNRILEKGRNGEIIIAGITDPDPLLCNKKKNEYQLSDSVFYKDLRSLLQKQHPDLLMVFNAPADHLKAIEISLPLHIPVMVEKPLCFSNTDAKKIEALSKKYNTKVYTNYPSLWYTGFMELLNKCRKAGGITKMIMRGGHSGPVEIGCSKDFLNWLTDTAKNGGGAITDFGCYGATIMTELMQEAKPVSVYAVTRHLKPAIYTQADDDATIVLEYKNTTGIIEASWNWPYTIMDIEAYGKDEYLQAGEFNNNHPEPSLISKSGMGMKQETIPAPKYKDEVQYLTAVIKRNAEDNNRQMSLQHNIIVVQVLDAARRSAKEGRKIFL